VHYYCKLLFASTACSRVEHKEKGHRRVVLRARIRARGLFHFLEMEPGVPAPQQRFTGLPLLFPNTIHA
jgi:hypothetical protein